MRHLVQDEVRHFDMKAQPEGRGQGGRKMVPIDCDRDFEPFWAIFGPLVTAEHFNFGPLK